MRLSLRLASLCALAAAPAEAQRLAYASLEEEAPAPRLAYEAITFETGATPYPSPSDAAEEGGRVREYYLDRNELALRSGSDGYGWDWSAYLGGSRHRLYLAGTGDGEIGGPLTYLEMQALYSRAVGGFDLQAGLRWDLLPRPRRLYLSVGAQGDAIEDVLLLGGHLFLSHRGELSARLFGTYDLPLRPRLILQPAFEAEVAAQDVPELGIGAGPVYAEAGLRLRYRLGRGDSEALSPYVGVNWERLLGRTARMAREAEEGTGGWSLLLGVRSWF